MKNLFAALMILAFLSSAALAAGTDKAPTAGNPVLIGAFGDWKAYYFLDEGGRVCFMSAPPAKQEGKFRKRGEVLFFVTHWAGAQTRNVVSVSAGYAYKDGGTATVTVDGRDFGLATVDETAWARDHATDEAVTEAIRRGASLSVRGVSRRGTATKDVYSLKGSADAYTAITKACET